MTSLVLEAVIDEHGRLVLDDPIPLPPGKVRVTVDKSDGEDVNDDGDYRSLVSDMWAESLADPAEDIYTEADGVPINSVSGESDRR